MYEVIQEKCRSSSQGDLRSSNKLCAGLPVASVAFSAIDKKTRSILLLRSSKKKSVYYYRTGSPK
jgi:hypothetical protein